MHIEVINKRNLGTEGELPHVYIGRPSPLGNPFVIGRDGNRDEVIAKYEDWLNVNLHHRSDEATAEAVQKEMNNLFMRCIANDGIKLVCWCAPQACHGDVIKKHLESMNQEMNIHFDKQMKE